MRREPADPALDPAELHGVVPADIRHPFEVREVIGRIVDHADFLEVQAGYAKNLVVGFGRINGKSIGIVANQPNAMAGTLNIPAGEKRHAAASMFFPA